MLAVWLQMKRKQSLREWGGVDIRYEVRMWGLKYVHIRMVSPVSAFKRRSWNWLNCISIAHTPNCLRTKLHVYTQVVVCIRHRNHMSIRSLRPVHCSPFPRVAGKRAATVFAMKMVRRRSNEEAKQKAIEIDYPNQSANGLPLSLLRG